MKTFSNSLAALFITFTVLFLLCSCSGYSPKELYSLADDTVNLHGGSSYIYKNSDNPPPESLISLYGRDGNPPDELTLCDYALIWYNKDLEASDGALFHLVNRTDAVSVKKMCRRRALTLKGACGAKYEIGTFNDYVYIRPENSELFDGLLKK